MNLLITLFLSHSFIYLLVTFSLFCLYTRLSIYCTYFLLYLDSRSSINSIHLLVPLCTKVLLCLLTLYSIHLLVKIFLTFFISAQASSVTLHSPLPNLFVTLYFSLLPHIVSYRCFYLFLICSFSILLISLYIY